ncbi:MAG: 50S ribosomal protein L4 [bacterium]|nr:50S ribosomal protein L4 [bacterium]
METIIYNQLGKKTGSIKLPEKVFNVPFNSDTVHEVVVSMNSNARVAIAHTKNRGDVRGGGRKPWQQKGLSRARHGSRRSPIWKGGGVTFGPSKDKNFSRKINKKVKVRALYMLLSQKLKDGQILFLDRVEIKSGKTKDAKVILKNISAISGFKEIETKRRNAAFIYISEKNLNTQRSFNNFGNISIAPVTNMNPIDLVTYKYIIITDPEKSCSFLTGKMKNKNPKN